VCRIVGNVEYLLVCKSRRFVSLVDSLHAPLIRPDGEAGNFEHSCQSGISRINQYSLSGGMDGMGADDGFATVFDVNVVSERLGGSRVVVRRIPGEGHGVSGARRSQPARTRRSGVVR